MSDAPVPPESAGASPRPLPPPVPGPLPRTRRAPSSWLVACLVGLIAGLAGGALGLSLARRTVVVRSTAVPIVRSSDELDGAPLDVAGVVAKAQPSVVLVITGSDGNYEVGTGVVVSDAGEILTNAHVVGDATSAAVRLSGEADVRPASVTAVNVREDLALLRLASPPGLTPIEFATQDDLQVGDDVVAIGYALGLDGPPTVTRGIVSGLDRVFAVDQVVLDGLVQVDAAISSGNSGGPLLDARGRLVGLTTAIAQGGEGFEATNVGFAIGETQLVAGLEALRRGETVAPLAFLGARIEDRTDGGTGALISQVVAGAPAARAGIEQGDVVVAVDGRPVLGATTLIAAIQDAAPGDVMHLVVDRGGQRRTVEATLTARSG